jgi:hypothetical protein
VIANHIDKVTVPSVIPDVAAAAMDAQHPLDLAVIEQVQGVVTVKGIGLACRATRQVGIQPALGDLFRTLRTNTTPPSTIASVFLFTCISSSGFVPLDLANLVRDRFLHQVILFPANVAPGVAPIQDLGGGHFLPCRPSV